MKQKSNSESTTKLPSINPISPGKQEKNTGSFFDDNFKAKSLWLKMVSLQQQQSFQKEGDVEGTLFKLTKKSTLKEKVFSIQQDKFINFAVKGKEKAPKKFIELSNTILDRTELKNQEKQYYGFSIYHNQKTSTFFAFSKQSFELWYSYLKKYCIQRSFHHHYDINKLIGKGNFAKVYSITNRQNKRQFAVKAFEKDKFEDISIDKPALIKELSIMRCMDHKGVLKLYEVFENNAYVFLVCELLEGGEFFHQLKKAKYNENQMAQVMHNILSAIEYIHSKGVLHRDIKPENLILRTKGDLTDICIADFGLADYYSAKGDYMFKRCGTPGYVAPELLQDKIYDFKIDIFSAGILMFIMLSGNSPFQSEIYDKIVMKNYNCEINFNEINKKVSQEGLELLYRLLAKLPITRPNATEALRHQWFDRFGKSPEQNEQFLQLNESLQKFKPSENPELYSKTPLMNQGLSVSINSTPAGITPNIRNLPYKISQNFISSNCEQSPSQEARTVKPQLQIQGTPQKKPEQQFSDTADFNIIIQDDMPQSGNIKQYQMQTKNKKQIKPSSIQSFPSDDSSPDTMQKKKQANRQK